MNARAWEVWVRWTDRECAWVKYRTVDVEKHATETVKRIQGEPIETKIVPLYAMEDKKL